SGGTAGLAHPVAVTSRSATVTFAWKNVVVTFDPFFFCSRKLYAPVAVVFAVYRALPLSSRLTAAPEIPIPDAVTLPLRATTRFALLVTRPASVTAPGPTNARASTVPAAFGTPFPVAYGVHSDSHRAAPTGAVKTLLT